MITTLHSRICFLKWKYYGTFTYITQYDNSDAHLKQIKDSLKRNVAPRKHLLRL